MNITRIISFATISMPLLCTGCMHHFTTRPGASGVVRDVRTGVPVVRAVVSVVPSRGDDPVGRAITDSDGTFRVLPRRRWVVYIIPGDVFRVRFTLLVQHEGYQQAVVQFDHRAMGEGTTTNFGVIRIESVTK